MSYKEGWWETKDGKELKIEDMETSHIKNTINYLKRHTDFYDTYWYDNFIEDLGYDDNSDLVENKINELEYELKKRGDNNV